MATLRTTLAHLMATLTGMDYQVALNWLNAENSQVGHGTNPLGIECGNSAGSGLEIGRQSVVGHDGRTRCFAVYRSSLDGIRAAAWLLMHGSHYAGVRAAIKAHDPAAERLALVNSGWAAGNYHGGSGFSGAGTSGGAPATITHTAPKADAILASANADADRQRLLDALNKLGISTDPAHVLTQQEAVALTHAIYPLYRGATLSFYAGMTIAQVLSETTVGTQIADAPAAIAHAVSDVAVGVLVNGAVLVVIVVLGLLGVRTLLSAADSS